MLVSRGISIGIQRTRNSQPLHSSASPTLAEQVAAWTTSKARLGRRPASFGPLDKTHDSVLDKTSLSIL
jgi:hypothetical protein